MLDRWVEKHRDALILIARILMTMLFVISGYGKLTDFAGTVNYMQYVHAPLPQVAAVVAIVMELLVGLALLLGVRVRWLALAMLVFVAGTSLIGHPFWTMTGDSRDLNQVQFLKNLAIMGGLLLLSTTGPGRYSATKS